MDRRRPLLSGSSILLLIRDGKANTWEDLCTEFEINPGRPATEYFRVVSILHSLRKAGLIDFESDGAEEERIKGTISITQSWKAIQRALETSLTQIADLGPQSLVVNPFWGRPNDVSQKYDLFVLMPFLERLRPVYEDHIKRVASGLSLTLARADDFLSVHSVMTDVWSGIYDAHVIIADCTGRNPNVFYEVGLAHVLGKPVVLIAQSEDDIPFDLEQVRFIRYDFTPRGMADFENVLAETIRTALRLRTTS